MGINKLLHLLEPVTHTVTLKVGADQYKVHSISLTSNSSSSSTLTMQDLITQEKHRDTSEKSAVEEDSRHLRVGIDISTWISAACHGNGAELLDERHLSNFGRSELERQQKKESDATAESRNQELNFKIYRCCNRVGGSKNQIDTTFPITDSSNRFRWSFTTSEEGCCPKPSDATE
jgi:hypothetical protein